MNDTKSENSQQNVKETDKQDYLNSVVIDVKDSPFKIYKENEKCYHIILGQIAIEKNIETLKEAKKKAQRISWNNIEKFVLGAIELTNEKNK